MSSKVRVNAGSGVFDGMSAGVGEDVRVGEVVWV